MDDSDEFKLKGLITKSLLPVGFDLTVSIHLNTVEMYNYFVRKEGRSLLFHLVNHNNQYSLASENKYRPVFHVNTNELSLHS